MISNPSDFKSIWFQFQVTLEQQVNYILSVMVNIVSRKKSQWKSLHFSAAQMEYWKTLRFQKTAMKINAWNSNPVHSCHWQLCHSAILPSCHPAHLPTCRPALCCPVFLPSCPFALLPSCPPALLPDRYLVPFFKILIHAADATFPFFLDKCFDWKSTPTTTTTTYLFLELWAELAAKNWESIKKKCLGL